MGFIGHYVMMHEVTQVVSKGAKPSITPFVKYLEAGHPINDGVRQFLLALLSQNGRHGVRLVLERTQGRKQTVDEFTRNLTAYDHYTALCDQRITKQLCIQYAKAINGGPVTFFTETKQRRYERQIGKTVYIVKAGRKSIRLTKGKLMPKYAALEITAKKFNKDSNTLRKTFGEIDKAKAVDNS